MATISSRLADIPWKVVRAGFFTVKKLAFSYGNYETDVVLPTTSVGELDKLLRKEHFVSGEYFSLEYKGEDLNVVRGEYRDGEYEYYQLHIRAFEISPEKGEPYTEVDLHYELDPRNMGNGVPHLKKVNFNVEDPIAMLEEILEKHEVKYRVKD